MKRTRICIGVVVIALIFSTSSFAFNFFSKTNEVTKTTEQNINIKTVTLDVPGMYCRTCPFTVKRSLKKLDGVNKVDSSIKTKTVIVTYDSDKLFVEDLIKATTDNGYPSTVRK